MVIIATNIIEEREEREHDYFSTVVILRDTRRNFKFSFTFFLLLKILHTQTQNTTKTKRYACAYST